MVTIVGKYQHVKNENMDEYFTAVGVPYIPRKLMGMSHPSLEINQSGDEWTIITSSSMRTTTQKFKMGEEFEEAMPSGDVLKNVASLEGPKLSIQSTIVATGVKTSRMYEFDNEGCVATFTHGEVSGKRYFKRL